MLPDHLNTIHGSTTHFNNEQVAVPIMHKEKRSEIIQRENLTDSLSPWFLYIAYPAFDTFTTHQVEEGGPDR